MKSRYIVLKTIQSVTRSVFPSPMAMAQPSPAATGAVLAQISTLERNQIPEIGSNTGVVAVAPSMPMKLIKAQPSPVGIAETMQGVTWGIKAVGAHTSKYTGEGIVVAVLDTGIDASHPAFVGVELIQKDFTGEGDGDANGHGTHCAGTIFGRSIKGLRIGVAPGIRKALIGKVLDKNGSGSSEHIVNAILWAIDQGAHVISISIGMDYPAYRKKLEDSGMPDELATSRALEGYRANTQLFDTLAAHVKAHAALSQTTIIVAAAGNESKRDVNPEFEVGVSPPAVCEGIVSVAALGQYGSALGVAPFSNTGANVSAPGIDILSAAPGGGLVTMSGTSMATPHVAGVAALWAEKISKEGKLSGFGLLGKLGGTATREVLAAGYDSFDVGEGLVQCPQ